MLPLPQALEGVGRLTLTPPTGGNLSILQASAETLLMTSRSGPVVGIATRFPAEGRGGGKAGEAPNGSGDLWTRRAGKARSAQRNPAGHPRAFHARATGPGWVDPLPAKAGRRGGEMLSESESMMSIPERSGERTGDGLRLGDHPGLPWVASESRMGSEFGAGSGPNSRTIRRTDGKPHFVILG